VTDIPALKYAFTVFKMTDYRNDTITGESYKGIYRNDFPNWAGWKEIDRHKEMYGFPENLMYSEVLKILYNDLIKRPQTRIV
jgi:hypothetical protein